MIVVAHTLTYTLKPEVMLKPEHKHTDTHKGKTFQTPE